MGHPSRGGSSPTTGEFLWGYRLINHGYRKSNIQLPQLLVALQLRVAATKMSQQTAKTGDEDTTRLFWGKSLFDDQNRMYRGTMKVLAVRSMNDCPTGFQACNQSDDQDAHVLRRLRFFGHGAISLATVGHSSNGRRDALFRSRLMGIERKARWQPDLILMNGGGRGIRTPVTLSGKAVFKTACFNRSHIPPRECYE